MPASSSTDFSTSRSRSSFGRLLGHAELQGGDRAERPVRRGCQGAGQLPFADGKMVQGGAECPGYVQVADAQLRYALRRIGQTPGKAGHRPVRTGGQPGRRGPQDERQSGARLGDDTGGAGFGQDAGLARDGGEQGERLRGLHRAERDGTEAGHREEPAAAGHDHGGVVGGRKRCVEVEFVRRLVQQDQHPPPDRTGAVATDQAVQLLGTLAGRRRVVTGLSERAQQLP